MQKRRIQLMITISVVIISLFSFSYVNADTYRDWTMINGVKYFYNSLGEQIGTANAKRVIDVSQWQNTIDWYTVKHGNRDAFSIDGAILRLGFGSDYEDTQLANNLAGVRANDIPYGVYLYSYADDEAGALAEAQFVERMIVKHNLNDMDYPIYYDLENFNAYHNGTRMVYAPNSVAQYEKIISTFIHYLNSKGYYNVQVYSYTNRIQNYMNSASILPYLGWIAEYNHRCNFDNTYYNGLFGWQYSSSEQVNGISGNVDVSCFYNKGNVATQIPSEVKTILTGKKLTYRDNYIFGFSLSNADYNREIVNSLSNEWYDISICDPNGNPMDLSVSGLMKMNYQLKFTKKESIQATLEDYQFIIYNLGDVNGDGYISSKDYNAIKNHITKTKTLSGTNLAVGDVNGDGYISSKDYNAIKNHITGTRKLFDY